MKQLFMWLLQKIMKITGKWISRSIFWKKHVRPQAILWTVIAQPACLHMHHKCMHMRFAWWAMLGSLFPNMACPNSDTWRVRIHDFFFFFLFFFFARVADEFSEVARDARDTRILHWREGWSSASWIFLNFYFHHFMLIILGWQQSF